MLNIRFRDKTNAWPGFVDLFSNLVIILIFLLIVFVFLWTTTSVFNKNTGAAKVADLEQTRQAQAEQIEQMNADRQEAEQLLIAARDALVNQETMIENQENLANAYESKVRELTNQQEELAQQIAALNEKLQLANEEKQALITKGDTDRQDILDQANLEINELNARIAELEKTLQNAENTAKQKEAEYTEMSNRLNTALAEKVAELNSLSQYQSAFYKQVKNALGDNNSVKADGDRFIIQSDILFPSGSFKALRYGPRLAPLRKRRKRGGKDYRLHHLTFLLYYSILLTLSRDNLIKHGCLGRILFNSCTEDQPHALDPAHDLSAAATCAVQGIYLAAIRSLKRKRHIARAVSKHGLVPPFFQVVALLVDKDRTISLAFREMHKQDSH